MQIIVKANFYHLMLLVLKSSPRSTTEFRLLNLTEYDDVELFSLVNHQSAGLYIQLPVSDICCFATRPPAHVFCWC